MVSLVPDWLERGVRGSWLACGCGYPFSNQGYALFVLPFHTRNSFFILSFYHLKLVCFLGAVAGSSSWLQYNQRFSNWTYFTDTLVEWVGFLDRGKAPPLSWHYLDTVGRSRTTGCHQLCGSARTTAPGNQVQGHQDHRHQDVTVCHLEQRPKSSTNHQVHLVELGVAASARWIFF